MIPPELIEAVAREACKQMGLDADAVTLFPAAGSIAEGPAWMRWAREAERAIAFSRAVKLCDTEGKG